MSWVRTAVNKAVEAGGNSNLTRTVRDYADSVVVHASNAVVGGAKILQDRIGARNMQSFKHAVKRLEEVSVSCRGIERVQLLRRWLVALKEIERITAGITEYNVKDPAEDQLHSDEFKGSPRQPTLVYYFDPGVEEPRNFRDVFLCSQALEGITLSMILEAPNDEEASLLSEIYGLCLTGGKEELATVLSSIKDLSNTFLSYEDEVLVKREELLQYAQSAITGLKVNADLMRIDDEACSLKENIYKMKAMNQDEEFLKSPKETNALNEAAVQIQLCSKLEELLLEKKFFSYGDSPESHAEKVDKLKILSESLANSSSKAEDRILEHRTQKEEALNFRVFKSNEVSQVEKELAVEIVELEKQKDELEAGLKKVNAALTSAYMRLRNAKEEREQFDEASNDLLVHLKMKEDELLRAIDSYKMEASVVNTWVKFLESTWVLQTSHTEKKMEQVNAELERCGEYFVNMVVLLLSSYKEKLGPFITQIRKVVENLSSSIQRSEVSAAVDKDGSKVNPRKNLEEEYLDLEGKLITTLSIVNTMKKQFYIQEEGIFRKDNDKVKELFEAVEKIKEEFESIERPMLEIETPKPETPPNQSPFRIFSPTANLTFASNEHKRDEVVQSHSIHGQASPVAEELSKLDAELSEDDSADEISGWEL
ncbi:hypothetical protein L6164_033587 [Bauhinia variegata]|uniref:Uncharacterized protein n=1 Tax=Bauhinia variegata TaxID=167791 RepID=A0ACB9KSP7_BAUVA|nr:hypothetical protein L6164_033587 [Bauhinia variegata]